MSAHLVNGQSDNRLSISDRGLNYGDGLFETIQIRDAVPLLWQAHISRMRTSAKRLKIDFPESLEVSFFNDFEKLKSIIFWPKSTPVVRAYEFFI